MFSLLMLRKRRTVAPQIIGITLLQYVSALDVAKTLNGSTANPWNSTFTLCFASWCCESVERSHRKSLELHVCIMFRLLMLRKRRTVAPRALGISLLHYVLPLDVAKTQNCRAAHSFCDHTAHMKGISRGWSVRSFFRHWSSSIHVCVVSSRHRAG